MAAASVMSFSAMKGEVPINVVNQAPLIFPEAANNHIELEAKDNGLVALEDTGNSVVYNLFRVPELLFPGVYGSANLPLSYDPISGVVAVPLVRRTSDPSTGAYIGTDINIYSIKLSDIKQQPESLAPYLNIDSTYRLSGSPVGTTPPIHVNPTMAVLNPTGTATEASDLAYMLYTYAYNVERGVGDPVINDLGAMLNIIDPINGIDMSSDFRNQNYVGPDINNTVPPQTFRIASVDPYQGDYGAGWEYGAYYTSLLSNPNENEIDANYGVLNFNLSTLTPESFIPSSWESDEFRTDAYYSTSHIYSDVSEADGTPKMFWTGINGFFSDDFDNRKIAVCYSTDGVTYSSWKKLPVSDINDYVASREEVQGLTGYIGSIASGYTPYTPAGFIALNDEEASFFATATIFKEGGNASDPVFYHLIQATFNRNTEEWTIEKVADISSANRIYLSHSDHFSAAEAAKIPAGAPKFFADNRDVNGNSIQVAKNPDGDIIVKYTRLTETIELENPVTYFEADGSNYVVDAPNNVFDSITVDEIFISYKEAGSTTWKEYQITYDGDIVHPYNFIPRRFGDRNNIPLMTINKIPRDSYSSPPYFIERVNDSLDNATYSMYRFGIWNAQIGFADLDMPGTSVNETAPAMDMKITRIYPNPVSDELTVSWSLSEARDCKVYISNAAGQKMVDVYEGRTYGLTIKQGIDVSNLSQGAYFITLEADGQKVSELVNIVR